MTEPTHEAVIFDDGGGQLAPLTDLRPSFEVRTGALTTLQRLTLALSLDVVALWVPSELIDLARDQLDSPINTLPDGDTPLLLINGRCLLPLGQIEDLKLGQRLVEAASGDTIAARLARPDAQRFLNADLPTVEDIAFDQQILIARPWHVKSTRDLAMGVDLRLLVKDTIAEPPPGVLVVGEMPISIDPTATVYPGATLVAEDGPIVVGPEAVVRPGAIILGPASIGPGSTILERALIKGGCAIGPVCKIAGEVAGTIFQGYANKAHDGHLGDSWVGSWVNLGAGTTNSNLLNTYGEVICQATPGGPRERTGETFLGAIIGDHVKTAIATQIMTGAILHTGGMFAATAPITGTTPPFVWSTDAGDRIFRMSKFIEVARTTMGRRDVEPSEAYLHRLSALHELASAGHKG